MILLGVNAAFGNADCGHLTQSVLDLEACWVTFPRPKTGIERRAFLWPETIEALKDAIAERPTPKDKADADRVFITKYGNAWSDGGISGAVTLEMGKLLKRPRCPACGKINVADAGRCVCGWKPTAKQPWENSCRPGLGFYALRHTFRTVADATRDFPAVRLVMGHADESIDDVYREHIDDARLRAVAEHVRAWLFGKPGAGPTGADDEGIVSESTEASDAVGKATQLDAERPVL
jgi:integrase